jgi:hypothetical protein
MSFFGLESGVVVRPVDFIINTIGCSSQKEDRKPVRLS